MSILKTMKRMALGVSLLAWPWVSGAVTMEWVTVGGPGNAADTTGHGAVATVYQVGKYEVSNAQYTEFLNAKAASDPMGLYNPLMAGTFGGIVQSGSAGSYTYSTVAGREDHPVVYVSYYDALRFTNWMNNGQGSGDTETGAYTLLGGGPAPTNGLTVTRNAGADIFLPDEDEWYKAAYYDVLSASYNPDPFADGVSGGVCEGPAGTTSHSANCYFAVSNTTDVGSYVASPSATGTFDQGGNVREWTETILGSNRVQRGGGWRDAVASLAAANSTSSYPTVEGDAIGFRILTVVPEPTTALLLGVGLVVLGARRRGGRNLETRRREAVS